MEQLGEAGIHSGDSACSIPPYTLGEDMIAGIREQARALAMRLGVRGLMNVQFAVKDQRVYMVTEGEVIASIYKLEKIEPGQLTLLYLPLQTVQTLVVGEVR